MKLFSDLNINEKLQDKYSESIGNDYKILKTGILELIDDTIESDNLVDAQNFMDNYIKDKEPGDKLTNFIEDNEIFNFYLKYQSDIDELCNDKNYFDESLSEKNIFSLYNVIIDGCKFAVKECISLLYNEIF